MAFTYSGDPSSSQHDLARFIIGDTVETSALLTDAEIDYIIANSTSTSKLYAQLFKQAAIVCHTRLLKRTLGPQSEDPTLRLKYFSAQAERYEKLASFSGEPPLPDYDSELVFTKDMMANEA